jgi:hypothetical protein
VPRRLVYLLVASLVALALAACGGGGDDADTQGGETAAATTTASEESILASVASNAENAGSSKVAFTITTQIPQQEGPITLTGEGEFDYTGQQGTLTYDFSELLGTLGQQDAAEPAEIILDGNVFYMKFPLLSGLIPGGKPWIKFDLESLAGQQGIDLGQLQQVNQGDPSQTLDYLRAVGSVEEVGTEEIRGVETTHYRGVIELDKAVELAPEESREQMRQSIEQLKEQTGLSELPIEVWVAADGLPAKVQYSFSGSLTGTEGGDDISTIFAMELFDWGTDVAIEIPPENEITDISELAAVAGATTTG